MNALDISSLSPTGQAKFRSIMARGGVRGGDGATATVTETKDRIAEIKTAIKTKLGENEEAVAAIKVEDGVSVIEQKHLDTIKGNNAEVKAMRDLLAELEGHSGHKEWADAPAGSPTAFAAAIGNEMQKQLDGKSLGTAFLDSEEFQSFRKSGGYTMSVPWEIKGADIASLWLPASEAKDVYTDLPSGTPGRFGRVQRDPLVARLHRTVRVRDLFPVQSTDAGVIEFFRVTGFTNAASPVPERASGAFGSKPHSTLAFEGQQTTTKTVAHWEVAHRNVIADEPQLRGIIDNELLYGLQLEEDYQILKGTGTSEDLLGILETPGILSYSQATVATDMKEDAIRRAATLSFLANYEPTGVVLHPSDWEKMELRKDANGNYVIAIAVAVGGEKRLWRMPIVDTPAIDEGTALVGAFGLGAQLYDREQANIRIAEQHEDFFVRNAVVVLAEERLALAVKRPESFVKVTLTADPSN
jgi:hypothetical protein